MKKTSSIMPVTKFLIKKQRLTQEQEFIQVARQKFQKCYDSINDIDYDDIVKCCQMGVPYQNLCWFGRPSFKNNNHKVLIVQAYDTSHLYVLWEIMNYLDLVIGGQILPKATLKDSFGIYSRGSLFLEGASFKKMPLNNKKSVLDQAIFNLFASCFKYIQKPTQKFSAVLSATQRNYLQQIMAMLQNSLKKLLQKYNFLQWIKKIGKNDLEKHKIKLYLYKLKQLSQLVTDQKIIHAIKYAQSNIQQPKIINAISELFVEIFPQSSLQKIFNELQNPKNIQNCQLCIKQETSNKLNIFFKIKSIKEATFLNRQELITIIKKKIRQTQRYFWNIFMISFESVYKDVKISRGDIMKFILKFYDIGLTSGQYERYGLDKAFDCPTIYYSNTLKTRVQVENEINGLFISKRNEKPKQRTQKIIQQIKKIDLIQQKQLQIAHKYCFSNQSNILVKSSFGCSTLARKSFLGDFFSKYDKEVGIIMEKVKIQSRDAILSEKQTIDCFIYNLLDQLFSIVKLKELITQMLQNKNIESKLKSTYIGVFTKGQKLTLVTYQHEEFYRNFLDCPIQFIEQNIQCFLKAGLKIAFKKKLKFPLLPFLKIKQMSQKITKHSCDICKIIQSNIGIQQLEKNTDYSLYCAAQNINAFNDKQSFKDAMQSKSYDQINNLFSQSLEERIDRAKKIYKPFQFYPVQISKKYCIQITFSNEALFFKDLEEEDLIQKMTSSDLYTDIYMAIYQIPSGSGFARTANNQGQIEEKHDKVASYRQYCMPHPYNGQHNFYCFAVNSFQASDILNIKTSKEQIFDLKKFFESNRICNLNLYKIGFSLQQPSQKCLYQSVLASLLNQKNYKNMNRLASLLFVQNSSNIQKQYNFSEEKDIKVINDKSSQFSLSQRMQFMQIIQSLRLSIQVFFNNQSLEKTMDRELTGIINNMKLSEFQIKRQFKKKLMALTNSKINFQQMEISQIHAYYVHNE